MKDESERAVESCCVPVHLRITQVGQRWRDAGCLTCIHSFSSSSSITSKMRETEVLSLPRCPAGWSGNAGKARRAGEENRMHE